MFDPLSLDPTQPPVPLAVVPEGVVLPEPHHSSVDTGVDAAAASSQTSPSNTPP